MNNDGLYIQLYNIHGLIRGENLELGVDSDTGGQTKYVLELALALSRRDDVRKIEIMTRLIDDKNVSKDYSVPVEKVNDKLSIVRIQCGGKKYIKKELLWDHLEEYVDKTIKYVKSVGQLPDLIHSHYADAGYVSSRLTQFFGIPIIHTGHSLGRIKLENLLSSGLSKEAIEKEYNITRRIRAEEKAVFNADRVITSTKQEAEGQWGVYENSSPEKFVVIPPSVDLQRFFPFNEKREWDEEAHKIRNHIRDELWKFFTNMYKPIILTICRPERRKNISGLIEAYGQDKDLQTRANLAIFAGIRKDITQMPETEKEILTEMLLLMDKYNLYGKMAIPKRHDVEYEVPELFRIAAETQGVFVNSAFSENFGLTLIESAASGLPVVSTKVGGPQDIIGNLDNGILVDVKDSANISSALREILNDSDLWSKFSNNGIDRVYNYYSWDAHVEKYINTINDVLKEEEKSPKTFISTGKKMLKFNKMIILDIDDTITGDDEAMYELKNIIEENKNNIGFGVATGRHIELARGKLKEIGFAVPEIIISSVGSEIYYHDKDEYVFATGWESHIKHKWKPDQIRELMKQFDFLELQDEANQRDYKISYNILGTKEDVKKAGDLIEHEKIKANLIISHGAYLDILPYRASKGRAIRYLAYRWNIPHDSILVAGDSGNDEDMLRGELLGVVVGNHSQELKKLKGRRRIYFAGSKYAKGVIEGINYYNFL